MDRIERYRVKWTMELTGISAFSGWSALAQWRGVQLCGIFRSVRYLLYMFFSWVLMGYCYGAKPPKGWKYAKPDQEPDTGLEVHATTARA